MRSQNASGCRAPPGLGRSQRSCSACSCWTIGARRRCSSCTRRSESSLSEITSAWYAASRRRSSRLSRSKRLATWCCSAWSCTSPRSPTLQPFVAYLQGRWQAGCTNVAQLNRELEAQGYRGSYSDDASALAWRDPRPRPRRSRSSRVARRDRITDSTCRIHSVHDVLPRVRCNPGVLEFASP